jgi:hypothetical protein
MLSNEGEKNLKLLQDLAIQIWGTNLNIINVKIHNAPFDIFEINMLIYGCYEILLEYEKGSFATSIKMNNIFIFLDKISDENIVYGFESVLPQNIISNFNILDKTLRERFL